MYDEEDYLLLSGLQHFCFCRRQWALIHIEQQWCENYHTTIGELFHKKAHDETSVEKRGDELITRGLRIFSRNLGLVGQCDVVEFYKSKMGIALQKYEGLWMPVPVEYKKGKEKEGDEDIIQLCVQAMCLEEMLVTDIGYGYMFYGESRKRKKVVFTDGLRNGVISTCEQMHELYEKGYTPKVKTSKKCSSCSLKNLCLPKLQKNISASSYIKKAISDC